MDIMESIIEILGNAQTKDYFSQQIDEMKKLNSMNCSNPRDNNTMCLISFQSKLNSQVICWSIPQNLNV